jgi:hypothetical protein
MAEIVIADPPLIGLYDPEQWPPFLQEIIKRLSARQPIVFAWGSRIYNPQGGIISAPLMAHELIHCARQADGVEGWWRSYIEEPQFRLAEEIPAYRAEFAKISASTNDREARALELHKLAMRLSSPLYGGLIDYPTAKHAIVGQDIAIGWRDQAQERNGPRGRFRARAEDAHR